MKTNGVKKYVWDTFMHERTAKIWVGLTVWKLASPWFKDLEFCNLHSHLTPMISISIILGKWSFSYSSFCE